MMKKVIYGAMSFMPILALGQTSVQTGGLDGIVAFIGRTVKALIPIMFGLAIVYFFWGLIEYIRSAGDPKKASEGKSIMIYGVIAIAVMATLYGIIGWLATTLGVDPNAGINIPSVPGLGTNA